MGICEEVIFSNFFKKNIKPLRNFIYYKYGNEEQATDAAQEAFIKLWQNCKNVTLEKAKSYIYTVANNHTLNVIAHDKVVLKYAKDINIDKNDIESPEFIIEEEQFKNKLLTAIQNLNETQRVTFLMHRIDGKKYAEIAEELNISVKAVEKRMHLALVELRKQIEYLK